VRVSSEVHGVAIMEAVVLWAPLIGRPALAFTFNAHLDVRVVLEQNFRFTERGQGV